MNARKIEQLKSAFKCDEEVMVQIEERKSKKRVEETQRSVTDNQRESRKEEGGKLEE